MKWIAVFVVLIVLCILFGRGDKTSRRALLINSDDAGMCSSVNKGTIATLKAGLLRSTSIMVCCPGFDEFAEFARSNPQYDYGVHLTLTCDLREAGWGSVLPISQVPSLIDSEGFFHQSRNAVGQMAKIDEVEAELRAQIRKALDSGIRITHLDHHMFVLYSRPDLISLYVRLGIEFGFPIRFVRSIPDQFLNQIEDGVVKKHAEMVRELDRAGLPILDHIESENYSIPSLKKRTFFLRTLRNAPSGVTEVIIHCAIPDESGIEPPDAAARAADASCFSTREFREELLRLRIEVLDWKELKDRRR